MVSVLCREANTIFRGNSLATRCIDDMMKIVGRSYLIVTLKPVLNEVSRHFFSYLCLFRHANLWLSIVNLPMLISLLLLCLNQIFESNKTCEIDPIKLKEGDNVEVNKVRWMSWFNIYTSSQCETLSV